MVKMEHLIFMTVFLQWGCARHCGQVSQKRTYNIIQHGKAMIAFDKDITKEIIVKKIR
jgi:hypothetical protein